MSSAGAGGGQPCGRRGGDSSTTGRSRRVSRRPRRFDDAEVDPNVPVGKRLRPAEDVPPPLSVPAAAAPPAKEPDEGSHTNCRVKAGRSHKKVARTCPSKAAQAWLERRAHRSDICLAKFEELPHDREYCLRAPYVDMAASLPADATAKQLRDAVATAAAGNESRCATCYCAVCDEPAAECKSWTAGDFPHCHATRRMNFVQRLRVMWQNRAVRSALLSGLSSVECDEAARCEVTKGATHSCSDDFAIARPTSSTAKGGPATWTQAYIKKVVHVHTKAAGIAAPTECVPGGGPAASRTARAGAVPPRKEVRSPALARENDVQGSKMLEATIAHKLMHEYVSRGRVLSRPEIDARVRKLCTKVHDENERRDGAEADELSMEVSSEHLQELALLAFGIADDSAGLSEPAKTEEVRA